MSKEEVLKYISENYELPEEGMQYLDDTEFCKEILGIEPSLMFDLPIEIQKKMTLIDSKYLEEADTNSLYEDKEFLRELIDSDNDVLLQLRGYPIEDEYIKNLSIEYIKGERIPAKGSKLEKMNTRKMYLASTKQVREDHDLALYLLSQDINYFPDIKDSSISENPQYIAQYIKKNPHRFASYSDKISSSLTQELVETVLKYDFQNYKLIDENNPLMEQFYKSIARIREIRPELKMDNPNLRYELLCDPDFINMDINIVNSLLEYDTGNVDKIIEIKNNGNFKYLLDYIEKYKSLYGNSLENIQNAISSFESVEQLLVDTNNFEGISIDDPRIKTIIATGNKFGINSLEDLSKYDEKVKAYYTSKIQEATEIEDIRKIYSEMLFNATSEELESFDEQYCNHNINEVEAYSKEKQIENPIDEEFKKRKKLYDALKDLQDIDELKKYFDTMPLTICDIEETQKKISSMYSKGYNAEMLDLTDDSLEHEDYQGIDVIKLNGQSFNLFIHRIFNFDFNMSSIANEIIENPHQWNLTEGSNTISTTLITDKKIAALFRPLQESSSTTLLKFDKKEKEDEYTRHVVEESRKILEGKKLKPIDENAVFYGFTETLSDGIIKMDSSDMMVEHGKGHLETNTSRCRMRSSEDLAYWTSADYWNEIVQNRKENDISKAEELRQQSGTDRIQPSCIICFDEKINEQSLLAARTHNIPIVMIDRQAYLDINNQKLEAAKSEFSKSLSEESLREIFYRQPYYKIVQDMPNLINDINSNGEVSLEDKKMSLQYLAYLGQHFIEQSSGYIIDVPVEEYNEKMQQYIQDIDRQLQGNEQTLVTMEDMKSAYTEIFATDRKRRYDAIKSDIRELSTKEGEIVHE